MGVNTHKEMHYAEVQDEKRNVMWHGRIPVSRDGFLQLLEKIRTIEKSNYQKIAGVYMNPTGTYHIVTDPLTLRQQEHGETLI